MKLGLIVARARNGVIGRGNALPWRLPEDLAHFRRTTIGHPVIMGRRTWDSIGRPLPGRRNLVVTRDRAWHADGAEPVASVADAVAACGDATRAFVIGGAEIHAMALPLADEIHLTEIDRDVEGDTFIDAPDPRDWIETSREPHVSADGMPFAFVHYARRDRRAVPAPATALPCSPNSSLP